MKPVRFVQPAFPHDLEARSCRPSSQSHEWGFSWIHLSTGKFVPEHPLRDGIEKLKTERFDTHWPRPGDRPAFRKGPLKDNAPEKWARPPEVHRPINIPEEFEPLEDNCARR